MRTNAGSRKLRSAQSRLTWQHAGPVVSRYRNLLTSRTAGQSFGYLGSHVVVLTSSAITSTILARSLTVPEFGSYSAVTSFLVFLALFFEFGLFVPAARAAADEGPGGGRAVFGAALVAFLPLAVGYLATVYLLCTYFDSWFNVEAADALRIVAPLTIVFPLQFLAHQMAQGMDRLHMFSLTSSAAAVAFALVLGAGFALGAQFSLVVVLLVSLSTMLLSQLWLIRSLRPQFRGGIRTRVRSLLRDARSYGFEVYLSRVLAIGTYRIDVLMVAALAGAESVALYTVAGAIATVVALPGVAMGAALFPQMTKLRVIPREWLLIAWVAAFVGALGAALLGRPVITALFSEQYASAADLLIPLAMAEGLRSVTALYTSFQAAHGRGKELRKAATYLIGSNVLLNSVLIPFFGAAGAAWASFVALLVNLIAHVVYYRRSCPVSSEAGSDALIESP